MEAPTVRKALAEASSLLEKAGLRKPVRDSRMLLQHLLALDKASLTGHPGRLMTASESDSYAALVARRAKFEPMQYITGVQPFWDTVIDVGPGCLVPRPETEILVEETIKIAQEMKEPGIADLGCGSGAILKALAGSLPGAKLTGVEISPRAIRWAKKNLEGISSCRLIEGDFEKAPPPALRDLDIVVSNPPYITPGEFDGLPPEIRDYEPAEALLTPEPFYHYGKALDFAGAVLRKGGFVLFEIGSAQAMRHRAFDKLSPNFEVVGKRKDYGGRLRVVVMRKNKD